jgi:hypothetical protein
MTDCSGDGYCLRQGDRPDIYEINICTHNCTAIDCPNFKVCKNISPKWIFNINNGTCLNCRLCFNGKLTFYNSIECPVCLEDKPGVKQVNCDHVACIDCFKRCNYGDRIPQPKFPYSKEVEDEYEENHDSPRWANDSLIKKYNEEFRIYEMMLDLNYRKEASLRICGICRK